MLWLEEQIVSDIALVSALQLRSQRVRGEGDRHKDRKQERPLILTRRGIPLPARHHRFSGDYDCGNYGFFLPGEVCPESATRLV